jgi:hypothetical protein
LFPGLCSDVVPAATYALACDAAGDDAVALAA